MRKLNNKGFLLVETIVVATFTLTVLVALFIQFRNLVGSYNNSYNYNSVEGIYNLEAVETYISQYQNSSNSLVRQLHDSSKPYLVVYNGSCNTSLGIGDLAGFCGQLMSAGNFETVLFTSSDLTELKEYVNNNDDSNISEQIRNLVNRLDNVSNQNRLIAEYKDGTLATIVFGVDSEVAFNGKVGELIWN